MDKEDYDKAKDVLKKALDLDPNFDLAKAAYLAIPAAALTVAAIIAGATSGAPAASSGIVAGAGAGGSAAGGGLSTSTILIGAGAVAVGGVGVAAAAGAFKGSPSSSSTSGSSTNSWAGTWTINDSWPATTSWVAGSFIDTGRWTMTIDTSNTATVTLYDSCTETSCSGSGCGSCAEFSPITFKGTLNGSTVTLSLGSSATLTLTINGNSISGSVSSPDGKGGTVTATCSGTKH